MANDNYNSSPFTPQYTLIQKIKELQDHVKTIYENEEQFNQRIAKLESKSIQFITLENVDLTADSSVEIDFSAADFGKAGGVKNCKLFIICSHGPVEYGARPVIFELSKFKQDLSLNEITFNGNVFSVSSDDKYVDTISAVATLNPHKIRIKFARVSLNFESVSVYTVDDDIDMLSSEFLDTLKLGDIIFSTTEDAIFIVNTRNDESIKLICPIYNMYYEYSYDENDSNWYFVNDYKILASGLDFGQLTHSFNELDSTLKQIVEDAIEDNMQDGVSCTIAQWNVIKKLLNESLYIFYNGYSLIKILITDIEGYTFGMGSQFMDNGASLHLAYDSNNQKLFGKFMEI